MRRRIFIKQTGIITAGLAFAGPLKAMAFKKPEGDLFLSPAAEYRPFVRWWWNGDKIEKPELTRELQLLKDAGIGGVEINPIRFPGRTDDMHIPSVQWLSKEWIDLLDFTLDETKRLGMTCDLIVGSGWPFGGEGLEQEERSQILTIAARNVQGPATYEVSVFELLKDTDPQLASPFDGRTAELLTLQLVPSTLTDLAEAIDLTQQIKDGIIKFQIPEGSHTLYALAKMTGFMQVIYGAPGAAGPVLNHYNKAAVTKFLNRMSGAITGQIGSLKGRLRAFFCDSLELEGANWCSDMAAEFQQRRGYALMPWLPFILFKTGYMGDTMDPNYGAAFSPEFEQQVQRVRYDFELTKTELFQERFIDSFTGWCRANGVLSRMQAYGRGYLPLEGSFSPDIPECETWMKYGIGKEITLQNYPLGRAYTIVNKYVSSAAHLKGKRQISCEELTNTEMVFFESLETLKIAADQSTISGVTHAIFHGFNYSPKDAPFPGWVRYGCYFNEHNTWWPWFKLFTAYKARLSAILQQGDMYADIAVVSPTADLWKRYSAQNDPFPQSVYPSYQPMIWETIHQNGNGCDYISEQVIQNSEMHNGQLRYGKRNYKAIFMIAVESMEPATAKKLLEFVQSGGTVFCIEKMPEQSNGWKDQQTNDQQIADYIAGLKKYAERFILVDAPQTDIVQWYRQLQEQQPILKPYLKIDKPNSYISQVRYQIDGAEVLFITNSSSSDAYTLNLQPEKAMYHNRYAWRWDTETGERYPFESIDHITLDLGPAASELIVFDRNKPKGKTAATITSSNPIPFTGVWTLEGKHINGTVKTIQLKQLEDIKDISGWADFCGTLHYRSTLQDADHSFIDLGKVEGISSVLLNGQELGTKWYGRRRYPLALKPGENQLEVVVTTNMGNYMKSLKDNPVAQYWTNSEQKNQPLQAMGLIGPVMLYTMLFLLLMFSATLHAQTAKVNVFLGTSGDHGQLSPAASYPFSMLDIGPQTYPNTHTGYEHKAKLFLGFTHGRLEGVGCQGSGGNLLIKPFRDSVGDALIKTKENASPGYYSVAFKNGISAAFTLQHRSGIEAYHGLQGLYIDLSHALTNRFIDEKHSLSNNELSGWIQSNTTCRVGAYKIYYAISFDQPVTFTDSTAHTFTLHTKGDLTVRVAFSSFSVADAVISQRNFQQIQTSAKTAWNAELNRVRVSGDPAEERLFYSLLYRTMHAPFEIRPKTYSGWTIWDNYKTTLPLLSIIQPVRYQDMVTSIAHLYLSGKKNWASKSEPCNTVRTEHAIVVLLDAYRKGYQVDLESIRDSLLKETGNLDFSKPDKALESSYDTWAMSQILSILREDSLSKIYLAKAAEWKTYWHKDFEDLSKADIDELNARKMYQGTIWQYRWFAPFDVKGLIEACGGENAYLHQLDAFFKGDYYNAANEPDIQVPYMYSGTSQPWKSQDMIRKYAIDTVVQYYYDDNYRGINPTIDRVYNNRPEGFVNSMDDDMGAMSAWYVLAAIGLSPACPGWPVYYVHVPLFKTVTIGKLQIIVTGSGRYLKTVSLNGKPLDRNWLTQQEIIKGGELHITAAEKPNKSFIKNRWVTGINQTS